MNATEFFWLGSRDSAIGQAPAVCGDNKVQGERTVGDAFSATPQIGTGLGSRRRVLLLIVLAVLKFVADQALPTMILLLSIQTALNYVVLTVYSGHVVPRHMMDYTLPYGSFPSGAMVSTGGPPSHVPSYQIGNARDTQWWSWWSSVVQVEFQSRSVGCLLYTITKDVLTDFGQEADVGHFWQIISAVVPFA